MESNTRVAVTRAPLLMSPRGFDDWPEPSVIPLGVAPTRKRRGPRLNIVQRWIGAIF